MEIANNNNASSAGDISTGATDTAALGAISDSTTSVITGHATEPALGGDENVNYGVGAQGEDEQGSDAATTSGSYGTRLTDGVQLSGDQRTNNVDAVDIRGSDLNGPNSNG